MLIACKVDNIHATVCFLLDTILSIIETYYTIIYTPRMITLVD